MRIGLRHPWADATTHLHLDAVTLLERLAVLVPRPRVSYGVLAPRATWRVAVVASAGSEWSDLPAEAAVVDANRDGTATCRRGLPVGRPDAQVWSGRAGLSPCGERLRLMALIQHPSVVERMLSHRRLPTTWPEPRPARVPPGLIDAASRSSADHATG